jgi:hypothetical protein
MKKELSFEFMYANTWYKYENSWIYRQNIYGNYEQMIPVVRELGQTLDNFSLPDKQNIMCAIVHGHTYGKLAGAANKVKEIKRVFCID